MELFLTKLPNGTLAPVDQDAADALAKFRVGAIVRADVKNPRNIRFLRKYHVLVSTAFDMWSERMEPQTYKGQEIRPNKDRFRGDLMVLCGFYDPVFNALGELRLQPRSISFANMSEEEFEHVYSQTIQVILTKILGSSGMTEAQLRAAVDRILAFD